MLSSAALDLVMFQYKVVCFPLHHIGFSWDKLEHLSLESFHSHGKASSSHLRTHRPCPALVMPSSCEKNVLDHIFRAVRSSPE